MRFSVAVFLCAAAASACAQQQSVTFGMRKLAFSTNQFGIDLYRALDSGEEENVALCPFCVGSSLSMLLLGAEGPSAAALRQVLYLWGLDPHEVHLAYHDLLVHLGHNLVDVGALRIAHRLSVQRHLAVHYYPFQVMLDRFYNASVHPLEAERSSVDAFFSRHTEGKAPQMLDRIPSPSANLVLLSALYFRGTLDMEMAPVREEGRRHAPFTLMRTKKARIRYGTHEYLNCTAVEVPFLGGLVSLLALSPRDPSGMKLLETRLSAQRLADTLNAMRVDTVHFQMPRIIVGRTQGRNLTHALYHLGLIDLFTPGHANLFGISPFGWMHLTDVAHATYVEVREETDRTDTASDEEASLRVQLDRPFLWFVMDNVAGLAIAMGKMVHPELDTAT